LIEGQQPSGIVLEHADSPTFSRLLDGQLEAMHARFASHRYPRHAHDYLVLGYIRSGAQSYLYRGEKRVTPSGLAFVVNVEEAHTGESASQSPYVLQTIYARAKQRIKPDVNVLDDPLLSPLLAAALKALAHLFSTYGERPCPQRQPGREPSATQRARDFIDEHYAEELSLSRLAKLVSFSPYYFARAFQRETGLPPHAHLDNIRLQKACALLKAGVPIATVALATGFGGQSHFTRRFKRTLGITPGRYVTA
jgi:AraC-like DNA-binding protein